MLATALMDSKYIGKTLYSDTYWSIITRILFTFNHRITININYMVQIFDNLHNCGV